MTGSSAGVVSGGLTPQSVLLYRAAEATAWEELRLCGEEAKHRKLCELLCAALLTGGPQVASDASGGSIITSSVRTTDIARAINLSVKWSDVARVNQRSKNLIVSYLTQFSLTVCL